MTLKRSKTRQTPDGRGLFAAGSIEEGSIAGYAYGSFGYEAMTWYSKENKIYGENFMAVKRKSFWKWENHPLRMLQTEF